MRFQGSRPRRPSRRIRCCCQTCWIISGRYISTDNAYVRQDMVSISPDVTGRIVAVNVSENIKVKNGLIDLVTGHRLGTIPLRTAQ